MPRDPRGAEETGMNDPRLSLLTEREIEIARFRARGLKPKDIALTLGVAVKTIAMSLYRVNKKLGTKKRADFLRAADEMGLNAIRS
jgi:DNA-binding NarL/FixJ family response regulator